MTSPDELELGAISKSGVKCKSSSHSNGQACHVSGRERNSCPPWAATRILLCCIARIDLGESPNLNLEPQFHAKSAMNSFWLLDRKTILQRMALVTNDAIGQRASCTHHSAYHCSNRLSAAEAEDEAAVIMCMSLNEAEERSRR